MKDKISFMIDKLEILSRVKEMRNKRVYRQFFSKCPLCRDYIFANSIKSFKYNMRLHLLSDLKKQEKDLIKMKGGIKNKYGKRKR